MADSKDMSVEDCALGNEIEDSYVEYTDERCN